MKTTMGLRSIGGRGLVNRHGMPTYVMLTNRNWLKSGNGFTVLIFMLLIVTCCYPATRSGQVRRLSLSRGSRVCSGARTFS
jgi:hypothetical protein